MNELVWRVSLSGFEGRHLGSFPVQVYSGHPGPQEAGLLVSFHLAGDHPGRLLPKMAGWLPLTLQD